MDGLDLGGEGVSLKDTTLYHIVLCCTSVTGSNCNKCEQKGLKRVWDINFQFKTVHVAFQSCSRDTDSVYFNVSGLLNQGSITVASGSSSQSCTSSSSCSSCIPELQFR